eukprot:CAMPEP_0184742956 /NCGR_PEP_ID=MMETSP0315-20130426/5883_1 /TAXON_ID=101924 /ORGANISM="Rhodosorus marinus, Strain UTEX LB 2760" /LENGTH=341 /DNA_ID=CAMNT_0027214037 /DNA_START=153 /DNA_END=1181 /DNA_ORIENTATION=-
MSASIINSVSPEGEISFARRAYIKQVRELWTLREQARVRQVERDFLRHLQRIVSDAVESLLDQDELELGEAEEPLYEYQENVVPEMRRYRECPSVVMEEVRALAQRHQVQSLLRFFTEPRADAPSMVRSASWGSELAEARFVTGALESEFRHQLEHITLNRESLQNVYRRRQVEARNATEEEVAVGQRTIQAEVERIERDEQERESTWSVPSRGSEFWDRKLFCQLRKVEEEVAQLRNAVAAGFDIQLDIQRAIRQEVASAIHSGTGKDHGPDLVAGPSRKTLKSGRCTVCLESSIDSLLYTCGHMCTCSACGRGLLANGQKCPICRAPVRDVVRCFSVSD